MFRIRAPIAVQVVAALVAGVLVFGVVHILVLRAYVTPSLRSVAERRSHNLARQLAAGLVEPMLVDDALEVSRLVGAAMTGSDIRYAYVTDRAGRVVVRSFQGGVPAALSGFAPPAAAEASRLVSLEGRQVRDIAMPVAGGRVGVLRIGIDEKIVQQTVDRASRVLLAMVALFLALGVAAAIAYARLLTQPLHAIVRAFADFRVDRPFTPLPVTRDDELGVLTRAVNDALAGLKAGHDELSRTQASLIRTEKLVSVGILAAGVAHDINNPLAGIRNALKRIRSNPARLEQTVEYVDLMLEATEQIESVVRTLLDVSRRRSPDCQTIDLPSTIDRIVRLCALRAERRNVEIQVAIGPGARGVSVDPDHLLQVLVNLVINSLDALEVGGHIWISTETIREGVLITVADDGPGIPAEVLPHVTEPFVTTKSESGGTGLGLSVSAMLVEEHGGNLEVSCPPEGGTRVAFWLPSEPGPPAADRVPRRSS